MVVVVTNGFGTIMLRVFIRCVQAIESLWTLDAFLPRLQRVLMSIGERNYGTFEYLPNLNSSFGMLSMASYLLWFPWKVGVLGVTGPALGALYMETVSHAILECHVP